MLPGENAMRVGVLGMGRVGRAIAARLAELGHEVVVGTRDPTATMARTGAGSLPSLTAAVEDNLAGKVLLDIANPLDFSAGMPPTLLVKDTDSLGEQIQRTFPQAKVVRL
jgi:8-hydroxy-5-deazaflavin:NADPH oxidoreductase